jgi:acetamidase/formamidase
LVHLPLDEAAMTATMPWGGTLALSPFFGVMGVAPPSSWGRITSVIPRAHGGNMDNKELGPGTTVYFPVFNEGALFTVGDGHGVQGDGEVCLTAIETALTGKFRLSVRKDMHLSMPRAETPTHYLTMGFDEDLDDALKQALRDMIVWIGQLRGLSKNDAYMLCSLAADLRVTQTVNVAKGVHCVLPKAILN